MISVKEMLLYLSRAKGDLLLIQNKDRYNFPMDMLVNCQKAGYFINKTDLPDQSLELYLVCCYVTIVC